VGLQAYLRTLPYYPEAVVTKGDLAHRFEDAKAASRGHWACVQAIQRAVPGTTVSIRVHRVSWRQDRACRC
jgi:hypothetical protein